LHRGTGWQTSGGCTRCACAWFARAYGRGPACMLPHLPSLLVVEARTIDHFTSLAPSPAHSPHTTAIRHHHLAQVRPCCPALPTSARSLALSYARTHCHAHTHYPHPHSDAVCDVAGGSTACGGLCAAVVQLAGAATTWRRARAVWTCRCQSRARSRVAAGCE
jgi:hypothetical protein